MTGARRLAWIAGAAALAAVVIAAVLALPDPAPGPRGRGAASPTGSAPGGPPPDAAASDRPVAAAPDAPPPAADAEPPERLVDAARSAAAAGDLARARSLLARAYAVDPRPATLLELAAVDFQGGHCREARRAVQRVIADGAGALSGQAFELLGRIGRCD
jgi:hypothetical protein